jgi:hypothetical protein
VNFADLGSVTSEVLLQARRWWKPPRLALAALAA